MLALLLSFNLFFWGTLEAETTSSQIVLHESDQNANPIFTNLEDIGFEGGILQRQIEQGETFDGVRKFPASVCLLFLVFHPVRNLGNSSLIGKAFSSLASKDLTLEYHNLRI